MEDTHDIEKMVLLVGCLPNKSWVGRISSATVFAESQCLGQIQHCPFGKLICSNIFWP